MKGLVNRRTRGSQPSEDAPLELFFGTVAPSCSVLERDASDWSRSSNVVAGPVWTTGRQMSRNGVDQRKCQNKVN